MYVYICMRGCPKTGYKSFIFIVVPKREKERKVTKFFVKQIYESNQKTHKHFSASPSPTFSDLQFADSKLKIGIAKT